jgi:hypothetical protein
MNIEDALCPTCKGDCCVNKRGSVVEHGSALALHSCPDCEEGLRAPQGGRMKIEVPTNTNTIKFVHLVYGGLFNYEGKYMMKITNLDYISHTSSIPIILTL